MKEKIFWGEMTRQELRNRSRFVDTAILPVGSLEQHGPHLPLDTDAYDAEYIVKKSVKELGPPRPPILPTIPYGVSSHHMSFKGTVTVSSETLKDTVKEIGGSIVSHGFHKLLIYNGHGGNTSTLKAAAQELKDDTGLIVFIDSGESMEPGRKELVESENDVHAGEYETSTSLANREELIEEEEIPEEDVSYPDKSLEFDEEPPFFFTWDTHELSRTGVLGNPKKATKEKGEKLWEEGVERLTERIKTVMEVSYPVSPD